MEKFKSGSSKGGTKENAEPQFGKTPQLLGSGSGFRPVDDGYFLTCAHVVKGGGKIKSPGWRHNLSGQPCEVG